jgi:hypothetical protein
MTGGMERKVMKGGTRNVVCTLIHNNDSVASYK